MLNKDPKALAYMVKYNKEDVALLEKVYERLAEVLPHKTHVGVMMGLDKWTCPKDGSKKVQKSKTRVTAAGTKQHQMQCMDCGSYYSISEKAYAQYLKR